jgi:glycosyltransferase involved in cell wall biosynthesis
MKILWATPWNVDSAIARVSATVVRCLKQLGAEVSVVRTEDLTRVHSKPLTEPFLARLPFQLRAPGDFDATVVHFGDHWPFHAKALAFLQANPCIAVLHDATMLNYFLGKAHLTGGRSAVQKLCDEAIRMYGPDPSATSAPSLDHFDWVTSAAEHWPFMHEIASKASAVVVHSDHCVEALPESCRSKCRVLMLPAFATPQQKLPRERLEGSQVVLCTIGHMNENKRAASVIRAIAALPKLMDRATYTLAGPITDDQRVALEALATELGFRGLRILGRVTDAEMNACLNASDVICCLRYPTLEGGSGSVLEGLQYGRPMLVTNAGFYRQLPDDMVWKVDPANEVADIVRHLEGICGDYPKALEKSRLGPGWVRAHCSAERYAEQIMDLCRGLLHLKAVALSRGQLKAKVAALGGREGHAPLNERIEVVCESLFGIKPKIHVEH